MCGVAYAQDSYASSEEEEEEEEDFEEDDVGIFGRGADPSKDGAGEELLQVCKILLLICRRVSP